MKIATTVISCLLFIACSNNNHNKGYSTNNESNSQSKTSEPDSLSASETLGFAYYSKSDDGWQKKIQGTLMNSAKVTAYKDFVIEINFLSKTNTLLKTKQFTIYESINPFDKEYFSSSEFNCDDLDKNVEYNLTWKLVGATPFVPAKRTGY